MNKALFIWPFLFFWALAPVPAYAQVNQINAISASPSPAVVGENVSFSVATVGDCSSYVYAVNYGDNNTGAGLFAVPPHTYANPGNYTVTVTPVSGVVPGEAPCTGSASVLVKVGKSAPRGLYCYFDGCNPTISAMPLSLPEPGNTVIFQGSGFGNYPGSAVMVLQVYGGPEVTIALQIDAGYWNNTVVVATIPSNIVQVVDQTATFQLFTVGGSASNGFNVPFKATRAYTQIPFNRINCSMTNHSPSDGCQGTGSYNLPMECFSSGGPAPPPGQGYFAYHASGWQISAGANDAGVDSYFLTSSLQNGWLVSDADFNVASSDSNTFAQVLNPYLGPDLYFGGPTANPQWQIGWNVDGCGILWYAGDLDIYGPTDVPY
jgi:hypothetical protein